MTIESTLERIAAALEKIADSQGLVHVQAEPQPDLGPVPEAPEPVEKPKRGRKAKAEPAPEPAPVAEAPADEPPAFDRAAALKACADLAVAVFKVAGRDGVVAALNAVGAEKVSNCTDEQLQQLKPLLEAAAQGEVA